MTPRACMLAAPVVVWALAVGSSAEESLDFRPVGGFLKLPEGMKLGPCSGVDIDSRGNVYVIQRKSPPVLCFDSSGKFLKSFGAGMFVFPHKIYIDADGNVWVVDARSANARYGLK